MEENNIKIELTRIIRDVQSGDCSRGDAVDIICPLFNNKLEQEEENSKLRRALKETVVLFGNQVRTNSELYQDNQELKKRIKELEK